MAIEYIRQALFKATQSTTEKNRQFQKIVSNFLLKVGFRPKSCFPGIVTRKPSMGS
jgi:hypothetical protein